MREVITNVIMRCDLCGSAGSEVTTKTFAWDGQEREVDLCEVDLKEVATMFDALMEKSRRPEGTRTKRAVTKRPPYSGDTRFNEWYNKETGLFECPGVTQREGGVEHRCTRQFDTPNGLAVHHKRKHGSKL
jgi:hypothetical protein